MVFTVPVRLFIAVMFAAISLPSLASAPATQSIGEQREAVLFWPQARREADFRRMYRQFPSDRVAHGTPVHALPQGKPLTLGKGVLASYMEQHHIAGVMVLQHGRVRLQRYALGFGPAQRW